MFQNKYLLGKAGCRNGVLTITVDIVFALAFRMMLLLGKVSAVVLLLCRVAF